jgi:sugar phosphate permease
MAPDRLGEALRYRWLILWVLAFGYILVYFHRLSPAVVAVDMMRDLQAGGTLLGLLSSAYFYPYAVMQLPAGLLADSWGPRRTITLFFGVAAVGSLLLGLAPSISWAIFGRTLVGLGVSMFFVPTLKVLAEWFRAREFATMTGILMAMGGVGSLSASTPLAFLSSWIGWRLSFVAVGLFTLVMSVLIWLLVRDRPADMGWPSPAEPRETGSAEIGLVDGMKKVLTCPWFWPLAIWFFFDCAVLYSFSGLWGGPYLMHVYGLTKAESGHILSMIAVGLIVGSPLVSFLSDRFFRARKPVLVLASAIVAGITAILAFRTDGLSVLTLSLICLGVGMFAGAIVVIAFTATKELFPVQMAGTSTGLVNLFPFLGSGIFQPLLGYLLERQGHVAGKFTVAGYRHAFLALFACGLATLLASIWVKETLIGDESRPLIRSGKV